MDEFRKRLGLKAIKITNKDRKEFKGSLPMKASKKSEKSKLEFRSLMGDSNAKSKLGRHKSKALDRIK